MCKVMEVTVSYKFFIFIIYVYDFIKRYKSSALEVTVLICSVNGPSSVMDGFIKGLIK